MAATATKKNEELVEVYIPKIPGEAPDKYVAINGKAWNIPRGKMYKVPAKVARMLNRAQAAAEEADMYSNEEQKKMKEIQGVTN